MAALPKCNAPSSGGGSTPFSSGWMHPFQSLEFEGATPFPFHPFRAGGGRRPEQHEQVAHRYFPVQRRFPLFARVQGQTIKKNIQPGGDAHGIDAIEHPVPVFGRIGGESRTRHLAGGIDRFRFGGAGDLQIEAQTGDGDAIHENIELEHHRTERGVRRHADIEFQHGLLAVPDKGFFRRRHVQSLRGEAHAKPAGKARKSLQRNGEPVTTGS